jgi:hypothetical protein
MEGNEVNGSEVMEDNDNYEDMEGLSVERQKDGNIRLMLFGRP